MFNEGTEDDTNSAAQIKHSRDCLFTNTQFYYLVTKTSHTCPMWEVFVNHNINRLMQPYMLYAPEIRIQYQELK